VTLTTPLRFGTCPATYPTINPRTTPLLPAYCQIFHENGDLRECDPLPLYTRSPSDSAPELLVPRSPAPEYKRVGSPRRSTFARTRSVSPGGGASGEEESYPSRAASPAESTTSTEEHMDIEPTISDSLSHSHRTPTSEQTSLLALARGQGSITSDSFSGEQDQSDISAVPAVPAVPAARTRDARSAAPASTSPRNPGASKAHHPSLIRGLVA
jgi:hypothetical protein